MHHQTNKKMKIGLKTEPRVIPAKVVKEYYKLKGVEIFFYHRILSKNPKNYFETYFLCDETICGNYLISKNYLGEKTTENELYSDENFLLMDEFDRTDSCFIEAIEKMQPNSLKIIEIPDDVEYWVKENDYGQEYVQEISRIWS